MREKINDFHTGVLEPKPAPPFGEAHERAGT
jgi:hypothetical protein